MMKILHKAVVICILVNSFTNVYGLEVSEEGPRRTFKDQINDLLRNGQVRSTLNRGKCMRRCMNVDEAKEVCLNRSLCLPLLDTGVEQCNGGADCMPLNQCSGLYMRLQRGNTPELTQLLRGLHCGYDKGNVPKICCPPEFLFQRNGVPAAESSSADPNTLLPSSNECGVQGNDRIVGGSQTDIDEHPWSILVEYQKPVGTGFYCGGVLISWRYAMTAAHCIKGADLPPTWRVSKVRLGEWNTSTDMDCLRGDCTGPVQDIPVEEAIVHEGYNPQDKHQQNDIALLRLSRKAQDTGFVKPICLPITNELRWSSYEGYDMEVAGWGKTETRAESDVKLKVSVPVVSNSDCEDIYQRVERQITSKQMCAGGIAGKDSCRGDSGGALMGLAPRTQSWMAIGVVSYGPSPCGTPGWPGVYTRVGAYMDWILSKLRP